MNGRHRLRTFVAVSVVVLLGLGLRRLHGGIRRLNRKADQRDAFGVFATKELRNRGASLSLGEVRPADAPFERDAWAEHFRLIEEGPVLVQDRVWANVHSFSLMCCVGKRPCPQRASRSSSPDVLRQSGGGKMRLRLSYLSSVGDNLWEVVVRVCQEQRLLLTEAAPAVEVI